MASLDVDSLSTNVLLEKTINIVLMSYSKVIVAFMVLKKKQKQITEMLSLTTKESIILFDMAFYAQVDGVVIGSQLEPSLSNTFFCHHKRKVK